MLYNFSIFDLLPYLVLCLLCLYSAIKNERLFYQFTFILVFIFTAIRYGIGYDYFNYVEIIMEYDIKNLSFFEWISQLLYYISKKTFPQVFFIINSFICLYPIYFVAKKSSINPAFVFFSFMMIPLFYLESLSIVRYSSALSLVFLSFYYFDKKQYFKYLLLCIIAGGIHTSGYIGLSFLILKHIRSSYTLNIIIFSIACFFHVFQMTSLIEILPGGSNIIYLKLFNYMSNIQPQSGKMSLAIFIIGLVNLLYWKRLTNHSYANLHYLRLYNIGVLCWGLLSFNKTLSLRISCYFLLFIVLLIPTYTLIFRSKRKSSFIVYSLLTIYFISSFMINISGYNASLYNRISALPYHTIFNPKDYQNYKFRFQ